MIATEASFFNADNKDLDCMDADLSRCLAHMSEGTFSYIAA